MLLKSLNKYRVSKVYNPPKLAQMDCLTWTNIEFFMLPAILM